MAAKAKMKPATEPQPLAVPTLPQATPATVPHDKPAPGTTQILSVFDAEADKCAGLILKAEQGRFAAWLGYCATVKSMEDVPTAATALQNALIRAGYARAKPEASDWKKCAIAYLYDKAQVEQALSPTRMVKVLDKDGKPVIAPSGEVRMRRPTSDETGLYLSAIRSEAHKAGKVPDTVWKPRAEPSGKDTGSSKLTSVQFDAVTKNLAVASDDQINSIFLRLVDRVRNNPTMMHSMIGILKETVQTAEAKAKPATL